MHGRILFHVTPCWSNVRMATDLSVTFMVEEKNITNKFFGFNKIHHEMRILLQIDRKSIFFELGFSTPEAALMLISFIWFLVTALPAIQLNLMETRLQFFYSFPMLLSMFVSIFICFGLLCLIWSTPNATTCMFGINCDYTTMLDAPGRFIAVPQLLRIQQMIGSHFVFPTEENGYAYTFNLQWMQAVGNDLNESITNLWGSSYECVAPHNCLANGTRIGFIVCLIGVTVASWLLSIFMLGSSKQPLPGWLKRRLSVQNSNANRRTDRQKSNKPKRSKTA